MKLLLITQIVDKEDANLGFFHSWIQKIAEQVDELTVLCLKKGSYDLPKNVTVVSLGKESGASRWVYLRRFYRTIFQRRSKYDGVFVHMNPEYVILGGLFWRMMGKRVLLWYTHKAVNLRLRIAARLAHGIFTASETSFRLQSKKVQVVGHGIDFDVIGSAQGLPPSTPPVRLVSVGRVSPAKDIETILLAMAELKKHSSMAYTLDIIGAAITRADSAYEQALQKLVSALDLGEQVRFLGSKAHSDVLRAYSSYHALVHTSQTGSLDKVVLEALANRLQVFTSSEAYADAAALDLVVLFPSNDHRLLAEKIDHLFARGDGTSNINGPAYVQKHHSLNRVMQRIIHYFN